MIRPKQIAVHIKHEDGKSQSKMVGFRDVEQAQDWAFNLANKYNLNPENFSIRGTRRFGRI